MVLQLYWLRFAETLPGALASFRRNPAGGIGPAGPSGLRRILARFVPFFRRPVLLQRILENHVTSEFRLASFVPFSVWPRRLSRLRPARHPAAQGGPRKAQLVNDSSLARTASL
jgi:hypothetical protein